MLWSRYGSYMFFRRGLAVAAIVTALLLSNSASAATAAEPSGAHPRLLLTPELKTRWQTLGKKSDSVIAKLINRCEAIRNTPKEHGHDSYMGFDWTQSMQTCLISWVATGNDDDAKTAMTYFVALLDDRADVGDGKGGDAIITRDDGYSMRTLGPSAALGYDWLHDYSGMTEDIRARARHRFAAWLKWYLQHGYRPRSPGTNYQAAYLLGATMIAIAQGSEAGADSTKLWRFVVDELWRKDMKAALAEGAVLDGGDWGEGWQYAPLSVVSYALAGRMMKSAGVEVPRMGQYLASIFVRHIYALAPSDRNFAGGDTESETPNLASNLNTLLAVAVGDTDPKMESMALSEIARLGIGEGEREQFPLPLALAAARAVALAPEPNPRASWATWYLTPGVGNLYARSSWQPNAIWSVMQCTHSLDIDHFHPDAGNVVMSRGKDDVLVDPSPYGTRSTFTSNAPTVESALFPPKYHPSQGFWSQSTRWDWAHQTTSGTVIARCDYADQFRMEDRPSDVPAALRDMVLITSSHGTDGTLVVIDRATSGDAKRDLFLRFRTPGTLALDGDVARTTVGDSALTIRRVASSSGTPALGQPTLKDCFADETKQGICDAARFPVTDDRLRVTGPSMFAVHVLDTMDKNAPTPAVTTSHGTGWDAVAVDRDDTHAIVVWSGPAPSSPVELHYTAAANTNVQHIVLDAPANKDGRAIVTATASGGRCAVTVKPAMAMSIDALPARPLTFTLDEHCKLAPDVIAVGGPTTNDVTSSASPHYNVERVRAARTGCCDAQSTPSSPLTMTLVVGFGVVGITRSRRRKPTRLLLRS